MKTYKRHITIDELRERCAIYGIPLNTVRYDEDGHDHVVVGEEPYPVYYNSFNGSFFGWRVGVYFSSDQNLDQEPWFAAWLDFFYTNEDLPE
jgi:hypothetical protein